MTNSDTIIAFILTNEGSAVTNNVADRGGLTHWGITLKFFQSCLGTTKTADDLKAMSIADAQSFYKLYVYNPLGFSDSDDLGVCAAVTDAAVLCGQSLAVRLLQTCLNVAADGRLGPKTLSAMRAANYRSLRVNYAGMLLCHFTQIVAHDATQQRYLYGWLCRAVRPLSSFPAN